MNRRWLLGLAMLALAGFAGADDTGWEAHVELRGLGAEPAALPPVLVPKQSVLLKVSVWMPDGVNWYPRYPHWDMPGATLLPLMMLTPSIEREHGGATQRGATQNYLLTPLAEGALRLSPTPSRSTPTSLIRRCCPSKRRSCRWRCRPARVPCRPSCRPRRSN